MDATVEISLNKNYFNQYKRTFISPAHEILSDIYLRVRGGNCYWMNFDS